jgi:hypothetical protein
MARSQRILTYLRPGEKMPEISRFFGIIVAMYYRDHGPPHFHAKYSGQTGVFSIEDLKLIEGQLPK